MVAGRNPLVIQTAVTAADAAGGQTATWSDTYTLWPVEIRGRGGSEEERHGRKTTVEKWTFKVRFGPTITTANRVTFAGNVLDILSVQDRDGMRRYLWLECERGA